MPRISALTPAANADNAQIAVAQVGASRRVTPAQIVATALAGVVAPPDVAAAGSAGAAATASRSDHTHAHGNQAGGALHAAVVAGGSSGFMTGAQATKLDGIEANADVTDAANVEAAGAVMDSDFSGSFAAELVRVSAGNYAPVKINRAATAAPTVNDDTTQDYSVGSRWYDTTNDRAYTCLDATTGAAVWREISVVAAAVAAAGAVMLSAYTPAHSLLVQQSGTGSPTALQIPNSTILGRLSGGGSDIDALTPTEVRGLLDYPASEVSFDNTGTGLAATEVQAALEELDARPSGGGQTIEYITGFVADAGVAANRRGYTRGADPLAAATSFTACVVAQPLNSAFVSATPAQVFGCSDGGSPAGGWAIQWSTGTGWGAFYRDNGFGPRTLAYADPVMTRKLAVVHLRVLNDGVGNQLRLTLFVNGTQVAEYFSATDGGPYVAGSNLLVGPSGEGAVGPAFVGRVHGAAYVTSALSLAAIADHAEACIEAAQLVDPATPFTDGWRVSGANPDTTWASFKGGASLTALGAPTALVPATKASPLLWA